MYYREISTILYRWKSFLDWWAACVGGSYEEQVAIQEERRGEADIVADKLWHDFVWVDEGGEKFIPIIN